MDNQCPLEFMLFVGKILMWPGFAMGTGEVGQDHIQSTRFALLDRYRLPAYASFDHPARIEAAATAREVRAGRRAGAGAELRFGLLSGEKDR
jgi:hypothetical protein